MSSSPEPSLTAAGILLAAGSSTRMGTGAGRRKPFLELEGRTMLERAAEAFARCPLVTAIVLVGHELDLAELAELAASSDVLGKTKAIVAGGRERTDSVRCGVDAVPPEIPLVAIHDAARALVRAETVERCIRAAAESGAALVAIPMSDTVKVSSDGRRSDETLDRSRLWLAQTPQAFRTRAYSALLARAAAESFRPTDDAALHETYVGPVTIVPGERANLKITTPEDLALAAAILRARREPAEKRP